MMKKTVLSLDKKLESSAMENGQWKVAVSKASEQCCLHFGSFVAWSSIGAMNCYTTDS